MLNDKFVYTICILGLVISGVYLTLIFQGLSLSSFISSLANMATIGGFFLAVYAICIWKKKSKLDFVYSELLFLQKQVSEVTGHFSLAKVYGCSSQKQLFELSLIKIFELENSLSHFKSTYELVLGVKTAAEMLKNAHEIENFKLHITLLRSLSVTMRHLGNLDMTDMNIIYLALSNDEELSLYQSQIKSMFINKNISFNQIKNELDVLGKAL